MQNELLSTLLIILLVLGPCWFFFLQMKAQIQTLLSKNEVNFEKRMAEQKEQVTKDLYEFSEKISNKSYENFESLKHIVQDKLEKISLRIQEDLSENFKRSNQTFQDVLSRLVKIDEAQKQIDKLSVNVNSLQDILTDKKTRGIFGEVQLSQILSSVFGETQKNYGLQYKLSSGVIVDAILFLPESIGKIAIDSKFPLENYLRMTDKKLPSSERNESGKEFKKNVKKHIDDIADKYIIENETASQAILFLPAEAIFAEVNAYHPELIEYAQKRRVWMSSPTTLMANLTSIQLILSQFERDKYSHIIQEELAKLSKDFSRYRQRWDKLAGHIENVSKDVRDIHISTNKITEHFGRINEVEFEFEKNQID